MFESIFEELNTLFKLNDIIAIVVCIMQLVYALSLLNGTSNASGILLPYINFMNAFLLVQELGRFEIILKFHLIFLESIKGLAGFLIYFLLMFVTFATTQGIIQKNLYRYSKIGEETGEYSEAFFQFRNAYFQDEEKLQDFSNNLYFVWQAMIAGEFEVEGQTGWNIRIYGYLIVLAANVVLLNLIIAILGSTYDEVIDSMNEKLLKQKNYKNMRTESNLLFLQRPQKKHCLVWMEYQKLVKSTLQSQTLEITQDLQQRIKDVQQKFDSYEASMKDQWRGIENKVNDLQTEKNQKLSEMDDKLKTVLELLQQKQ